MVKGKVTVATHHFPKKGERFVDGKWVMPAEELVGQRQVMTASERRNWFRKKAGWPALREKS